MKAGSVATRSDRIFSRYSGIDPVATLRYASGFHGKNAILHVLYDNHLPFRAKLVTSRKVSFSFPFLKRKKKGVRGVRDRSRLGYKPEQ